MKKQISFSDAFIFVFKQSVINAIPLVAAIILYILTIWIPYINVGTTIALSTIPIKISHGHIINPLFIFDSVYREKMGEYLLLVSLTVVPVLLSFFFMVVPAIVLSLSWSLAIYLLLDKRVDNPVECLVESNRRTKGYKWQMFIISFILFLGLFIVNILYGRMILLFAPLGSHLHIFLLILLALLESPMSISLHAYFYKVLVLDVDRKKEGIESVVETPETEEAPVV